MAANVILTRKTPRTGSSALRRRSITNIAVTWLTSGAVAVAPVVPAFADVTATPGTGTTVTVSAITGQTNVTTSNLQNSTAFNQFDAFDVGVADTVNLYQPLGANKLINIISGGASTIDGTVNAYRVLNGNTDFGGDVYFVNSDGFVVGASGVINAGHLTLSTPTAGFMSDLITEANGGVAVALDAPTAKLFAGEEPLNPAGVIDIQGDIFATRLDMRAGLRMIVDGDITVETDLSTGRIRPAVNLQGVPTAGGVSIGADGVIRLVSGGEMDLGGSLSAKGSTGGLAPHGGLIEGIAEGEMTVGGTLDVAGGAGDAGSVMMFTKGSAVMENALSVDASSTGGDGGFFALRAVGDVTRAVGDLNLAGATAPGEGFVIGKDVTVDGTLITHGGHLGMSAAGTLSVEAGAGISTRAPDAVDALVGAPGAGAAGDLILTGPTITVKPGATLRADSAAADGGGMLALVARNTNTGIAWAINPESETAKIDIDQASLIGGSIVVSAYARASNELGSLDDAIEETQVDELEGSSTEAQFEQMLDDITTTATLMMERGITTLNGLVPVQVQVLSAEATVSINQSEIIANGNWDAAEPILNNEEPEIAENGYLFTGGLRADTYEFLAAENFIEPLLGVDNAYAMNLHLPSAYDAENDALLINSHAETLVNIAPLAYGLGLAVAVTDTNSNLAITDSTLRTDAGDIRLASTAMEQSTISIAAKKIKNGAAAVVVSVRDLENQLLVKGGSLTSAGALSAGAFSGRDLTMSTVANSGQEGEIAIAVNVDISTGHTEAALGGQVTAEGDVALDAEMLFFGVTHDTSATMGLGNLTKAIARHRTSTAAQSGFAQNMQQLATGKAPDPDRKPHFGMGVAFDLQLSHDTTRATIGGDYTDLSDPARARLALGTTSVTALGHNVAVNSAYRFADRGTEGGAGLTRSSSAAFGKLTAALKRQLDRYNAANPANPITQDELLGRYSNALMLNVSLSSMVGETTAEIGPDATVTAGALDVNALTRYPSSHPLELLIGQWNTYVDQVTDYSPVSGGTGSTPPEPEQPPAPDLAQFLDIVNPLTYLTTQSKAKGEAPVANDRVVVPDEEQGLALGVTLTYFNTDNATTAAIREGATVVLDDAAKVTALQEAVFLHVTNLPKKNPISGDAKVNDSIGGGIHLGRTVSKVTAEIESGAAVTVHSGNLDVTATTRNVAASLAFTGGQGKDVAVNASIAAQISEADTVARIGEAARIRAQAVTLNAIDNSVVWSTAGAVTGSENVGVGASGAINFSRRDIWAGIGPADRAAPLAAATGTVIDAETLSILAQNNALTVGVGVAGTKVVAKEEPPAGEEEQGEDMIIPSWLFSDEENDAANAQQDVDTPADQQGQQQKSGWAASGSAVLNLSLGSNTSAEILTEDTIELGGALDLIARSNAVNVNVTGAVSSGIGSQKDTNALAGAFSVHVEDRILRSRITGATINAGDVTVRAEDLATVVNIAVGGAGTSRGDLALAGSVAWATLGGQTIAEITDAALTTDSLALDADDRSTTVSVGGAVGVNMDATQGYGVGVGVSVNTVNRAALARLAGASTLTTGAFAATADSTQGIYGFATSAGVGKTGLAGSIGVNTITGGAQVRLEGEGASTPRIEATGLTLAASETNTIFSLTGALAGGRSDAVGGALGVNVITATTEALAEDALITARSGEELGAVIANATSASTITSIAVAGAAALNGTGVGIGLSGNAITAKTGASLARSTITDAGAITLSAINKRNIASLAGGAAAAGKGAAGGAATVNLLLGNDTTVSLAGADLSTRDGGSITGSALANGTIKTAGVGISAASDTALAGAVTLNVATANTKVLADGAALTAGGALSLSADDAATIQSLAGGAALSAGGSGVGGAISANFIAHDTGVQANGSALSGEGVTLDATNSASIQSAAVGLAVTANSAFAGSIAIGDIGNTTQAQPVGTTLNAGAGAASISAARSGAISILSGSAAVGAGGSAVGGAISVATIHGGVAADLSTAGSVSASALSLNATSTGTIDALAVSGAAGLSGAGVAGSLVYTQIGQPGVDGPSVDPLPGPEGGDPLAQAQGDVETARDAAISDLQAQLAAQGGSAPAVTSDKTTLALAADDVTRARLELTGTDQTLPGVTIAATDTAATQSLAGAVAGGSSAGIGAGIALNLLFGKAEAEVIIPDDTTTTANALSLSATQTGQVTTAGVAGGGGGNIGGAGSITVNVMNRQASARLASSGLGTARGTLATLGGDIALTTTQGGTISSLAGSVGIGGNAGFGGAIVVNVMSDDAEAIAENVVITTAVETPVIGAELEDAGALSISADQTMTLEALSAAIAGSGGGAFAGSFAVNVADGQVLATLRNTQANVHALRLSATANPSLAGMAGAISGSGAAVGVGIVTNVTRQTVRADGDRLRLRAHEAVEILADATGHMTGLAISGAVGASVGVSGSAVGNSAENTVEALVRSTDPTLSSGSDIVTHGTVIVNAGAKTTLLIEGGADGEESDLDGVTTAAPSVNVNIAGGGAAGVGASASVVSMANDVTAAITGSTRVIGLGGSSAELDGTAYRGVYVGADATSDMAIISANGAVGGVAGVAALFGFSHIDDSARVVIGESGSGQNAWLNTAGELDYISEIGTNAANAAQDVTLRATADSTAKGFVANIAVGGGAGVGAAANTTLVSNLAEVAVGDARLNAADDIDIDATSNVALFGATAGVGAGYVGVSANATVNRIGAQALVSLDGATLTAGDDISARSHVDASAMGFTGALAGGVVGAAGGVQVTLFETASKVTSTQSDMSATGALSLEAETDLLAEGRAISGAVGLGGVALAANLSLIEAQTRVDIGAGDVLRSGGAMTLAARDEVTIGSVTGTLGGGALAAGASIDYVNFAGTTAVGIGEGAQLLANLGAAPLPAGQVDKPGLTISATSRRDVDSNVVASSLGGAALSGALSVVELGALAEDEDNDRAALLTAAQDELASDQSGDDGNRSSDEQKSTGASLVSYAGGDATRAEIVANRQSISLTDAPATDAVSVTIGANAQLRTRGAVTLTADAQSAVTQLAGAATLAVTGGGTSGVAVANSGTNTAITIGDGAGLYADYGLTLSSSSGAIAGRDLIDSTGLSVAASGGYSAGVGISVATLSNAARITVGDGVAMGGELARNASHITFDAARSGTAKTDVFNLSLGAAGGVGASVSSASTTGTSAITLGRAGAPGETTLYGDTVALTTSDTSRASAEGEGSTGGVAAGLNSVTVTALSQSTSALSIADTLIDAGEITVANTSAASAAASAKGIAAGAVGIGASVANSQLDATLTTTVNGRFDADAMEFATRIERSVYDHSVADAASTTGGILAGNGAVANAYADYALSAAFSGTYEGDSIALVTDASAAIADAYATGRSGAALAIGVTIARAGQSASGLGSVSSQLDNATLEGQTVTLRTDNAPSASAHADSGSGGLISGSGAEMRVTTNTSTTSGVGVSGAVMIDATTLQIATGQVATLAGKVDTVSAAAVGASGADARTSATSTVLNAIGGLSDLRADNFDIAATNSVQRPEDGFNITSGSGGALDVAAMVSRVDVSATTDLSVADGAALTQTGLSGNDQIFHLGTYTDMTLVDRLKLDAGGAIAVPVGDGDVVVNTNRGTLTIGAATLSGVDVITLYAGGNSNLKSEVDSTSYGLAGAATAHSLATYNATNEIVLNAGALVDSLGDVRLQAGYGARQAQDVAVNAESRVFNKTAIPIPTDPSADATANTTSRISIADGASILAVSDVYLLAEKGGRDVLGYGRGKDLYREVAAEIGSAISEAFDGEPVSLDIESGTSLDYSDDGIIVDGYVRAGSRNQQVLILDANNAVDNTSEGYTDEMLEGITYQIRENISIANELGARIAELDTLLNDPILSQDAAAVLAWQAERDQLGARLAGLSGTADFIDLGPIVASKGNIFLRADYVHGGASGVLDAPGNAEIIVRVYSDAFLNTSSMTIPEKSGGRVTFNDIVVSSAADIQARSDILRPGPYDYAVIDGNDAGEPTIDVATYGGGSLIINGDINNADGLAQFTANGPTADLDVRADVSAKTVRMSAGRDYLQGFTWGFTHIEGEPDEIYESYFDKNQALVRALVQANLPVSADDGEDVSVSFGSLSFVYTTLPGFTLAPRLGRVRGGRNVYISADKLNINGIIEAGTGSFDVAIGSGLDAYLDEIIASGTSATVLLHNPAEPVTVNVERNPHISGDVMVKFDPNATNEAGERVGKLILDPMVVQGGVVELTGNVFSTGGGQINSLDGYGRITVDADTSRAIELGRLDAGDAGPAGQGVEGLVRITDTSLSTANPLITEFRRIGSTLETRDSRTFTIQEIDYNEDGITDIERKIPTYLVASSTANDGRSATFTPTANRDLIFKRAEEVTQVTEYDQTTFYFWAPLSDSIESDVKPATTKELPETVAPGLNGTYLGASLGGDDYAYHLSTQRVSNSESKSAVTTDDQRILGIGDVDKSWTETQVSTHIYTHRLKADYGVQINFKGADTGALSVSNRGDVILTGAVNNLAGATDITSLAGSVLTSDNSVLINTGALDLAAYGGRIGGLTGSIRTDLSDGAVLNATARDRIEIDEIRGALVFDQITTTDRSAAPGTGINGAVILSAQGDILGADGSNLITGSTIDLTAISGEIGSPGAPVRLQAEGAPLRALANGDITLQQVAGDLYIDTVTSQTGSVEITSAGALLDRNDIQTRDSRTEAQLAELWTDQLGLNGAGLAARELAAIAALKGERKRAYDAYWAARTADGGAAQSFAMDADLATSLLAGGWTQEQLDAYVSERQALFAEWNALASFDADYDYVFADEAALVADAGWSEAELNQWIRAGLIKGTGDTNTRIEAPNVSAAGDITLHASTQVGELLAPHELGQGSLADDLAVLANAERADITPGTGGAPTIVTQAEDLNFAFTAVDADGHALGNLRVTSPDSEIFLAAQTAANIANIATTGDVRLKIDGALLDARDGDAAITGAAIIIESGNDAPIGTPDTPLTLDVLAGGQLTARAGLDLNIHAIGDLPLEEIFSGSRAQISATGAITDRPATGAVRVRAADLMIDGASVGAAGAPLVIELTDTDTGRLDLTTQNGDAVLLATSDLPISRARIAGGGMIATDGLMQLIGADVIGFDTGASLALVTPQGIDLSAASGTDITGGALSLRNGGTIGSPLRRLQTEITTLSHQATGAAPSPLWVTEADDLRIETITQSHADSDTDIIAGGAVSIGTVTSAAEFRLLGTAITEGRILAERTELTANGASGGIGDIARLDITTGALSAKTLDGSITLLLRDRSSEIEEITAGGAGAIDLLSTDAPLTLLAGPGITTQGGAIMADVTSLITLGSISSAGGDITLTTLGDFDQGAGSAMDAGTGVILGRIGGDLYASDIRTDNATAQALDLAVTGTAYASTGANGPRLTANAAGAGALLEFGALDPVGPTGFETALNAVDITVQSGAMHLNELDGLILTSARSTDALIDIFTHGETIVGTLAAGTGDIVLASAAGDMLSDGASLTGGAIRLLAFGGDLTGQTGTSFMADSTDGATLHLLANGDLYYTETAGDLRLGYGLSETGNLTVQALTGRMDLGVLGAEQLLQLEAQGAIAVNIIGRATVDLADEAALALIEPARYGLREARNPDTVDLTAHGAGSTLYAGLINAKNDVMLYADHIDAFLYDATPFDHLNLTLSDPLGDFAETVDVQSIGDGPVLAMSDLFEDVRPRLAGRDTASGALILPFARIGTGQVTHAGPEMLGLDVAINGDVWFRQRSFDLFALIDYVALSTEADAQIYATNNGALSFSISDEIVLQTTGIPVDGANVPRDVLVLNRRLGGVDLNGGQGFAFGVGVETDILGYPFTFKGTAPGVTHPEILRQISEQHEDGGSLFLPQFITSEGDDDPDFCVVTYSTEPCLELSMLK